MADCDMCHKPLPAQRRGRPRKRHADGCTRRQDAARKRDRRSAGSRPTCVVCEEGTEQFCSPAHRRFYESLSEIEKVWLSAE